MGRTRRQAQCRPRNRLRQVLFAGNAPVSSAPRPGGGWDVGIDGAGRFGPRASKAGADRCRRGVRPVSQLRNGSANGAGLANAGRRMQPALHHRRFARTPTAPSDHFGNFRWRKVAGLFRGRRHKCGHARKILGDESVKTCPRYAKRALLQAIHDGAHVCPPFNLI